MSRAEIRGVFDDPHERPLVYPIETRGRRIDHFEVSYEDDEIERFPRQRERDWDDIDES